MACSGIPSSSACGRTSRRARFGARTAEKTDATLRNTVNIRYVAKSTESTLIGGVELGSDSGCGRFASGMDLISGIIRARLVAAT
jgi:hypothetical protein